MFRKTIIVVSLLAGGSLVSGCVGVDPTRDGAYKQRYYDNESYNYYGNNRDRDRDGYRNSQDRRY